MNFQALKWMVDSILEWYICPECSVNVWEENIEIIWTAGTNVNLEVICPKCWKNAIIKGQVLNLDLWKLKMDWEKLKNIQKNTWKLKNKNSIKKEEISSLSKTLDWENLLISDLFWKDEK